MLRHISAASIPRTAVLTSTQGVVLNNLRHELDGLTNKERDLLETLDDAMEKTKCKYFYETENQSRVDQAVDAFGECSMLFERLYELYHSFRDHGEVEYESWKPTIEFLLNSVMFESRFQRRDEINYAARVLGFGVSQWDELTTKAPHMEASLRDGCPAAYEIITDYFQVARTVVRLVNPTTVDSFVATQQKHSKSQAQYEERVHHAYRVEDMRTSVRNLCAYNQYRV